MSHEPICKTCAGQIKRMSVKPYYTALDDAGRIELARTLHKYGHEKADVVIDEALLKRFGEGGMDRIPTASDLWGLCKADVRDFESRKAPERVRPNLSCQQCNGTGYETITALDRFGTVVEGARRCRSGCGVPAREVA